MQDLDGDSGLCEPGEARAAAKLTMRVRFLLPAPFFIKGVFLSEASKQAQVHARRPAGYIQIQSPTTLFTSKLHFNPLFNLELAIFLVRRMEGQREDGLVAPADFVDGLREETRSGGDAGSERNWSLRGRGRELVEDGEARVT